MYFILANKDKPAMQAVMKQATLPAIIARNATCTSIIQHIVIYFKNFYT